MNTLQRHYGKNDTLRSLIIDNNMLLMVTDRFNIPFGFGDATVAQICAANGVDTDTFLAVCNLLTSGDAGADVEDIAVDSLIGYLKRAHVSFLDVMLPRIRQHLIEGVNYSSTDNVSFLLMKFFDDYVMEVKRHMEYENDEVFRYAERLLAGDCDQQWCIADFSGNHGHMASKLRELKDLFIYHYNQAENTRLTATLFDIMICEKDLLAHFEVENRLFIPAVEALEKRVRGSRGDTEPVSAAVVGSATDILGEREKEILRCVAQGKSNKEIADELCISIHTVTTHRRNICAKLDIHSAAGLTIFAILHKLVDISDTRLS